MSKIVAILALLLLAAYGAAGAVVLAHNDLSQTGSAIDASLTSPVTSGQFGKLGSFAAGRIIGQPLYVSAVVVSGTPYNLIVFADIQNYVYAYNADAPNSAYLWRTSQLGTPGQFGFNFPMAIGIISTPVIDTAGQLVYVVSSESANTYKLRKISLLDGSLVTSTTISGTVSGVTFNASSHYNRPALTLANGNVYVCFASGVLESTHIWHGFIFAYSTSTMTQVAAFTAASAGYGAGIWMSGAAPAVDGSGNLYVTTGNGTWDGAADFSETVLKLSPTLTLLDWFTPSNQAALDTEDADVSSNRFILIAGTTLGVIAAKDFNVYVVDTACMGHVQGSSGCALQTFKTNAAGVPSETSGSYGGLLMNGVLYLPVTSGGLYAFSETAGTFNTTPIHTNLTAHGFPGPAALSGSWNGVSGGLVWTVTAQTSAYRHDVVGTLRAFDTTLTEVWNSGANAVDALGNISNYAAPLIAGNGRVYVSTIDSGVIVYGPLPSSSMRGAATKRGASTQR